MKEEYKNNGQLELISKYGGILLLLLTGHSCFSVEHIA